MDAGTTESSHSPFAVRVAGRLFADFSKCRVVHMLDTAEVGVAYDDIDGPLPAVSFSLSSHRRLRAAGSEP